MAASKPKIRKTDKRLRAFVQEVTATLLDGKRHQTPGLGTFSTCTRKATADRAACKMAMFRASTELREYASGGPPPPVSGPHVEVVSVIVEAMQSEQGIDVPLLGRMAVVPVPGKKPKLIFHGAEELNDVLAAS
jgi:nucleoid DNA-binding protein